MNASIFPAVTPEVGIAAAVERLRRGELIAFPTETVYGLGADAMNPDAVAKIFALKQRPADHPLIVHVAPEARLEDWALEVPAAARRLADDFWPGPLTLILRKSPRVPAAVTGGQDTVGLRCPSHPVAEHLLREFARAGSGAIAAPSANRFGHVSPTTARHVRDEFGPDLLVLDGGSCEVGLESTILDLSRGHPVLLRPGAVTREAIGAVLGRMPADRDAQAPRASGTLAAHYAPRTPVVLVEGARLEAYVREQLQAGRRLAVLARSPWPGVMREIAAAWWHVAPESAAAYAHDLYANLRELDAGRADLLVVEAVPPEPAWEAVRDRLQRAAAGADENDET
jgi:L-threonylcarbamoyladenylate synthase